MKRLFMIMAFLFTMTAYGQFTPRLDRTNEVTDLIQKQGLTLVEASSWDIGYKFLQNGTPIDLSAATTVLFRYVDLAQTLIQPVTGTFENATNGQVLISFTPADLNTNGTFDFRLEIKNSTATLARTWGELRIIEDPTSGLTNQFPTGTIVDWSVFTSYLFTSISGPYRPGTNVTFSSNGDGSVNIDSLDTNAITTIIPGTNITVSGNTVSHSNTSDLVSIDNSDGTVIQDLTVDGHGHATAVVSVDLDIRFYTKAQSDSNDTVVSNGVTVAFGAADTIVSNGVSAAFASADTVVSNGVTTAFVSSDTIVSNAVTAAFIAADTVVSNGLNIKITDRLVITSNLSDVADAATSRTNLGVAINIDVQGFDSDLSTISSQGESAYLRLNRNNTASPNTTNTFDDLIVTNASFKGDPDFGEKVLRRVGEIQFDGVSDGIIVQSNNTTRTAISGGSVANDRTSGGFLTLGGVDDDANAGDAILGAGTNGGLVQLISSDGTLGLTIDDNGINAQQNRGTNAADAIAGDDWATLDQARDASIITNAIVFTNNETFTWTLNGSVSTSTEVDGFRMASGTGSIKRVWMILGGRGNNGDTIVDVNVGSVTNPFTTQQNAITISTIYTNQSNRPTLAGLNGSAGDNAVIQAALPDIATFSEGDFFSIDIDSDVGNNSDLSINMFVEYD